jgi:hypothetical protein
MPVSKKRSKVAAKRVALARKRSIVQRQRKAAIRGTEIPLPNEMIYEMMLHLDPNSLQKACQTNRQFANVCSGLGRGFWERYAASYNVDLPWDLVHGYSNTWTVAPMSQFLDHIRCLVSWRNAWRIFVQEAETARDDPDENVSFVTCAFMLMLPSELAMSRDRVDVLYWVRRGLPDHHGHYTKIDKYGFRGNQILQYQVDVLKHTRQTSVFEEIFYNDAQFPVGKVLTTYELIDKGTVFARKLRTQKLQVVPF